jgi:hypothetical protein
LEAFRGRIENELAGGDGSWQGEKIRAVKGGEGQEVVTEDLDEPRRVAGRLPGREVFGINGSKLVGLVRVAVRDAGDGVADRADDGDQESGKGGLGVVTVAEASTAKREMGNGQGERGERGSSVCDMLK